MVDGFYGVEYWKDDNAGVGILLLRNGKLLGCDITGGSYTGSYEPTSDHGYADAEANVDFEGGVDLVFDFTTPEDGLDFDIKFTIQKYGGPTVFKAETPFGTVNYRLHFLRDATWLDSLNQLGI